MGEEEGEKKKRVVVESLGWLTESSIMPKKHRAIGGVGASSILELKAQLYKSQEESKRSKEQSPHPDHLQYQRAKKKITPHNSFLHQNSGVQARNLKDKLELKAVNDGSASYAALEKKAELYDKLARGELSDEEEKEKYCVDFFRKGYSPDESQQPLDRDKSATESAEAEDSEHDFSTRPIGLGRTTVSVDHNEHKRFVREVHEEANEARERVSELKLRREEQVAARREKLKKAYLQKQLLQKLKAKAEAAAASKREGEEEETS